jgi:iron complex transport system permease protein
VSADFVRDRRPWIVGCLLAAALLLLAPVSLSLGAAPIPLGRVVGALMRLAGQDAEAARDALIVWHIRSPRLALCVSAGAVLGLSGALMQGLFRNPLADPGLVGVSGGAGLAAAAAIVLGDRLGFGGAALLPVAAFLGALAATTTLYALATRQGRTSIATILLAGVALAALAGSLTGLLAFISDDRQLRDLTFWSMGSLGGANWSKAGLLAAAALVLAAASPFLARGLNAMALGEAEAFHLGVNVQRLKIAVVFLVAVAVGISVAAAGVIGFIGIVAPHASRLMAGPDHRALLPLSALAGAVLLSSADIFARMLAPPAEIPIGVLTAAIGAPFFLWLLLSREGRPGA